MTRPPDRGRARRLELDGTIAENIAYGNPHAARNQIKSVSPVAHCGEFVELFEKQYDTIVGERRAAVGRAAAARRDRAGDSGELARPDIPARDGRAAREGAKMKAQ